MKLIIDTHVLVWWLQDQQRIRVSVRHAMISGSNEVFVSAAAGWELATKLRLGKLAFDAGFLHDFDNRVRALAFEPLSITCAHAVKGGLLPGRHKDPFDRLIAGQALCEDLTVVTADPAFAALGAPVLW